MSRKTMIAAGHRPPVHITHAIAAEALEQERTEERRASFRRWAVKGWRHADETPGTDTGRRGYAYGRHLRAEHEEIRRYGPGPLHGLADFANNLLRTIAGAQGAYRGGI